MSVTGQVLRVHERLYVATDGRVGHRMIGVPTLLLRSVGRRSGKTRTNALVYARDGADYLIVASNGGGSTTSGQIGRSRSRSAASARRPRQGWGGGVIRTSTASGGSSTRTTAT